MPDAASPYLSFMQSLQAEKGASAHTLDAYGRDLQDFFAYAQLSSDPPLSTLTSITYKQLRAYLGYLARRGYARRSINRRLSALRRFFKFLIKTGHMQQHPMRGMVSPRLTRRLPNFLTPDGVTSLITAPPDDSALGIRDRAILELLYATGIRLGELVNLDLASVEMPHEPETGGGWVKVFGKGGRERIVPVGRHAVVALHRYLHSARPHLVRRRSLDAGYEPALFISNRGRRLSRRGVAYILRKYAVQVAPGRRITPHTLRHTFATHLLGGGADLRSVQELLGHRQLNTTQIYTHVTQEHVRRAYQNAHPRA